MTRLTLAGSTLALATPRSLLGETKAGEKWPIIAFSKAFQNLNYEDTAELVAEVGWEGIECPVRAGGQVLPERVEDDLPKMVAALKKRDRKLLLMTTDIRNVTGPHTEKVLRTASKLGIRLYRLASIKYGGGKSIPDQLNEVRAELRDLVALNQELGLCAGFQNHSGSDYMGAAVWDIYEVIKDLDRRHLGACFDIGHATIEGGYAWPIHARLMEPYYCAVYVKDFTWQKGAKGWQVKWCPLGEGMINSDFFARLKKSGFSGPISQHHEYAIGRGRDMVRVLRKDLDTLKRWLGA